MSEKSLIKASWCFSGPNTLTNTWKGIVNNESIQEKVNHI